MFLNKGKKFVLGVFALSVLSSSVIAANKQEREPEPVRLSVEKEGLLDDLTTERLMREKFPINEEDGIKFREKLLEKDRLTSAPIKQPEILFRSIDIDTKSPGKNNTVYLSPDYVTTLLFTDKSGAEWPIENYILALGENVYDKDLNKSSIVIAPKGINYGRANMVVMLKGNKTPVIISVEISPDKVDYQAKVRVDDYGPNSQPVIYKSPNAKQDLSFMGSFAKDDLYSMLEGISPPSGDYQKRKTSAPQDVEAWVKDKVMYIRTKDTLISPSMIPAEYNKMQSNDDTYLYTVPYMPVVVLSRHGQVVQIKIY